MTEEELVYELKLGNPIAFQELLNLYQKSVIAICYRFLLNEMEAEDIAQEVFLEVYLSIKNFKRESKLSTWIFRISTTKSLDELRKRRRKKRISSIGKIFGLDLVMHLMADPARPDELISEKESFDALQKQLDSLPENQRIALTLSKIDNYNSSEVGEVMGISAAAVDSLVYRAKQSLRRKINYQN